MPVAHRFAMSTLTILLTIAPLVAADPPQAGTARNEKPKDMSVDSPVKFPKTGCLPPLYPPDRPCRTGVAPEPDYFLFSTPERSLDQIHKIQAAMPKGRFLAVHSDWTNLPQTRKALISGGDLHVLGLGDSIVNDTMRSGWLALLQEAYPKTKIRGTVYVRGGGGCQHYKQSDRIQKVVAPLKPDLVLIGGISQQDTASIRAVIRQLRTALPAVEILLATGTFGTSDPRDPAALAAAPHSGSGAYGRNLRQLAQQEHCAYLDMTTPWAEYIRSSGLHPHRFYRDAVHANEFGEQILAKILAAYFLPATEGGSTGGDPQSILTPKAAPRSSSSTGRLANSDNQRSDQ